VARFRGRAGAPRSLQLGFHLRDRALQPRCFPVMLRLRALKLRPARSLRAGELCCGSGRRALRIARRVRMRSIRCRTRGSLRLGQCCLRGLRFGRRKVVALRCVCSCGLCSRCGSLCSLPALRLRRMLLLQLRQRAGVRLACACASCPIISREHYFA
jgi:hypothetical protein